eukprot:jgi/Psemu1/55329/gm1.55329_g
MDHLIEAVRAKYTFKVNWTEVQLSMDGYVEQALKEFEHTKPTQNYAGPLRADVPAYGERIQYAKIEDVTMLTDLEIKFIQQDNRTMLSATKYFLNYAACNPDATIIYRASDMILHTGSDAAYLVCSEAKSRAGGYYYFPSESGLLRV